LERTLYKNIDAMLIVGLVPSHQEPAITNSPETLEWPPWFDDDGAAIRA